MNSSEIYFIFTGGWIIGNTCGKKVGGIAYDEILVDGSVRYD
jgi:hypothetical protein